MKQAKIRKSLIYRVRFSYEVEIILKIAHKCLSTIRLEGTQPLKSRPVK